MFEERRSADLLAAKADPEQSHHSCSGCRQEADTRWTYDKHLPCDGSPHFANGRLTPVKRLCTSVCRGPSSKGCLEARSVGEIAGRLCRFVAVQAHGVSRTFCWSTARSLLWCLTFELRRDRQQNTRPARWKMCPPTARAWCFDVGPRLERGVRHCCQALSRQLQYYLQLLTALYIAREAD